MILFLFACEANDYNTGRSEFVQVRDATFHEGALPANDNVSTPEVVFAAGASYIVTQGLGNIKYKGLATPDAASVAIAATGISNGYWTVPLGGPDVTQDNDLPLSAVLDFLPEVPYGLQTLSFVAIDTEGNSGPQYDSTLCVLPDWSENNLAACSDEITPPNRVVSLRWDTNVDLDLVVVAPNGKVVRSDAPTTGLAEDNEVPKEVVKDPTTGRLSRDSNADCHVDGIRLESLIFPEAPPEGDYKFYASLNAACGQGYVNFSLSAYERTDAEDGSHPVTTTALGTGELVAAQADDGEGLGTFLTTLSLP